MKKKIWIGSLFFLLALLLRGQNPPEKFRLVHSDKLFLNKAEKEQVLELAGKVNFFYGRTEFSCDRALILDKQKIARLTGNVKVSNDTLNLSADSLAYYRIPQQMNLGGNVYITEKKPDGSEKWFRSQFANYDKVSEKLTVWKDVEAFDLMENAHVSCGYAFWDRLLGYAYMIEKPKVRSGTADTLYIESDKIEFFDEERKIVATFNVSVKARDYTATSDFLLYFVNEERAVFTGEPIFVSDYARAEAREFYLYFNKRELKRAELVDSCMVWFAEDPAKEKTNWVRADNVSIAFDGEKLKEFQAKKSVSYYYEQEKQEKRDYFLNQALGESLEAKFNPDNKLDYLNMKKNIKGVYKFHTKS